MTPEAPHEVLLVLDAETGRMPSARLAIIPRGRWCERGLPILNWTGRPRGIVLPLPNSILYRYGLLG